MLSPAKRWGLHRTTVAEHLRRFGVEIRQRGVPAGKLDEAIQLYREGWSCWRLAKHYDYYRLADEHVRQLLEVSLSHSQHSPAMHPERGHGDGA
jgi:hypothetical protein